MAMRGSGEQMLVVIPTTAEERERLEAQAPEAGFAYASPEEVTEDQLAKATVVIGNVAPERLTERDNIRWVQLNSAGSDPYVAPGVLAPGTLLTSASGAYGQAVAEHMLAMLLSLQKRLPAYRDDQRAHAWDDHGEVASIAGSCVVVLGVGDIGGTFARLAKALGARVIGVRRHAGTCPEWLDELRTMDELDEVLAKADSVVSFLPATASTRHLADADFFARMRRGAYFANGGRGATVDQDALVEALESGHLAGAALDVCEPEPLPKDSPLWDAPNLLLTPHVAGGFHLPATLRAIVGICTDNLSRYVRDEELRNLVTH